MAAVRFVCVITTVTPAKPARRLAVRRLLRLGAFLFEQVSGECSAVFLPGVLAVGTNHASGGIARPGGFDKVSLLAVGNIATVGASVPSFPGMSYMLSAGQCTPRVFGLRV